MPALLRAALLLALFMTVPAHAQWKWRDANGRITVSDLPPPRTIPDRDILQRPDIVAPQPAAASASEPASAALPAPKPAVDRELQARREAAEADKAAQARAEAEQAATRRAENCRRAQAQLRLMQSGQRIVRINEQGEREFLDDQAREAETSRARQAIASECG